MGRAVKEAVKKAARIRRACSFGNRFGNAGEATACKVVMARRRKRQA
jgi:hypothetical protein